MRAIRVVQSFSIDIVEIPEPEINSPTDVIIQIESGGICGSDIGIWNGTNSLATYPRIIGHEFGGRVAAIGSGVTRVCIGDQAAVDPVFSCGSCYACRCGRHNVCAGLEVMGVHRDGGFTQYVKVPEENVHKFSKPIDKSLTGLVEPFTIGAEINRRAQITRGDNVLIMGAGPIGICAMQTAKRNGAQVMMTDLEESRLIKAAAMGADRCVQIPKQNLDEEVLDFTGGEGMPVIVDTVCQPFSFEDSVRLASPAGRVVVLGLKKETSAISMSDITRKELTIVGSRLNNHCFPEVIAGFEDGTLQPEELMTHQFHFTEIKKALELITKKPGEVLKVGLTFE